ncbi:MAG: hypothetical protein JRF63_10810 [Deltaproteobacteria bacterium]|nr:hypothetical protein [Deltaproteobacteria bacterium]
MKNTPLAEVKERFGSKENLVKELRKLFDKSDLFQNHLSPDKGLARVANAKLLKLYDVAGEVKERFSTRTKLTEDLLKLIGRQKDEQYKASLGKWGLPRLWDYYKRIAKKHA